MPPPGFDIERLRPWLEVRFSRSPAPGGQNVNKVNTRVTLLFDFASCPELVEAQRARIRNQLRTRMSRDGRLQVVRYRERTQTRNRAEAEAGLIALLNEATWKRKARRPTHLTAASRQRRLDAKRQRSEVKRQRQQKPTMDH